MPLQSSIIIPQEITVLPNVIVTLHAPSPCTFTIDSSSIPGNGILTTVDTQTCTVQGSSNLAEWGRVTVKGVLADGNFGLCECYFLVPFTISPAGDE
jgi:hypothetical protein